MRCVTSWTDEDARLATMSSALFRRAGRAEYRGHAFAGGLASHRARSRGRGRRAHPAAVSMVLGGAAGRRPAAQAEENAIVVGNDRSYED